MEEKELIAGIYIRVSTIEQATLGYSIDWQEHEMISYCKAKGFSEYYIYKDEGISAKTINKRPAVTKLIEDIKNKQINCLVVYKMDRLTRDLEDYVYIEKICNENNCTIFSSCFRIDNTTEDGEERIRYEVIAAQRENKLISRRITLGKEQKARNGYYNNNNGVFGYNFEKEYEFEKRKLVINLSESIIVENIFNLFLYKNKSMNEIAKYLFESKIPTKRNGEWCQATIKSILTNKIYIGYSKYKSEYYKGNHEPIISEEIFSKVQQKISTTKNQYKKMPKENVFYAPKLFCSCGCGLKPKQQKHNNKLYPKYYCSGNCKGGISHELVDSLFCKYIDDIKFDNTIIVENDEIKDYNKKIELIKNEMNKIDNKISKLIDMRIDNKINEEFFVKKNTEFQKQKNLFENQILQLAMPTQEITFEDAKIYIFNFSLNWSHLENTDKHSFINQFINKITIDRNKNGFKIKDILFY
jgi:site-specific DNA recombinase